MKHKLLLLAVYICTVIFIAYACTRQEITADKESPVLSNDQLQKLADANQVGEKHNQALDYLASKCDLRTVTNEQKFQIISDFFILLSKTDKQKAVWIEAKERGCSFCGFSSKSVSEWINTNRSKLSENEIGYMLEMEKL